jgi:hypothetical protein
MSIDKKAMLVELSISQWYNRASDKRATDTVRDTYHVKSQLEGVLKKLLPKHAMKEVNSCVSRIRTTHRYYTLPWTDGGVRLLPTKNYFQYNAEMNDRVADLHDAVDALSKALPSYIEQAKGNLEGLFNEEDYPTSDTVKNSFRVSIRSYPVPSSGDFRVDVPADELEKLRGGLDADLTGLTSQAVRSYEDMIRTKMKELRDVLITNGDSFRQTRLDILQDVAGMAEAFNLEGDAEIEELATKALGFATRHTAAELRGEESLRDKLRQDITDELNDQSQEAVTEATTEETTVTTEEKEDESSNEQDGASPKQDDAIAAVLRQFGLAS